MLLINGEISIETYSDLSVRYCDKEKNIKQIQKEIIPDATLPNQQQLRRRAAIFL